MKTDLIKLDKELKYINEERQSIVEDMVEFLQNNDMKYWENITKIQELANYLGELRERHLDILNEIHNVE